jgi:hypothetical protein
MERSKQIQTGLVALLALMLIGFVGTGIANGWFGQSEDEKIRSAASTLQTQTSNVNAGNAATNTASTGSIANEQPVQNGPLTTIKYDSERFEFAMVDEGEVVSHVFKFTNTGKEPLLISNAKGSCGCTVPTWPKEPIPPGGAGELKVEFNTKGKPGRQSKRVTVTANTVPTETFLEVTGEVKGKDMPAAKGVN